MSEQYLPRHSRKILRALIEVVKPAREGFDLPLEDFMVESMDEFYSYFPFHMKVGFPLGLLLLEYGTFIFMGRPSRFSRMSMKDREEYVRGWVNSGMALRRDLIKGVKGICLMAYYSHPEVMAHIGYDLEEHLKRVNDDEPCDPEAVRFFRDLGYDRNVPIGFPAYDRVDIITHDTAPEGGGQGGAG